MENKNIKILLIEDSVNDVTLIKRTLGKSVNFRFQVTAVRTLHDALKHLGKNTPDIILSDLGLPDSHGLDTVTKILLEVPHIPLVILSGFDDEAVAIKAVQSGAQDYLVKGQLECPHLEHSLAYSIERVQLQMELEQHIQEIINIQKNLHKILEKNADAIVVVSQDKRIMFTNPAVEPLFGRRQKELLNQPFEFPLNTRKSSEIRIPLKDNGENIAEINAVNISWEGKPAYLVSLHNITNRKRAEKSLKESEEKFSRAFQASANLFAINNLKDGKFIEVNDSFTRMTGYTREEVIGHNANELNLWVDEEDHQRITRKTRENKGVRDEQITIRSKSGEIRTGLFSSEQITINGEACFIHTITDITELKQAEEALKVSEEKFSKAFLHSPQVIVISNIEDGTMLEANDSFLRLTDFTREEVIGRKSAELGIWAIPEERAAVVKTLEEKGMATNRECKFRMKSGEIRTWLFSAEIINLGNKPCMLSVTTDITERKQMEEELRYSDTALKSIHEGVFAMDNEFKINRWNEMCEQMFGIKASNAIGKSAADVIKMVEEYEGQNVERVNLLMEKGFNREEQIYRTPRGDIWVDVHAQAIEENGQRHGWVTLVSDITDRKKAEEALRFSDAAFKSIHESVIATDTRYVITHWNKISEAVYGIKASQAIGKKLLDVIEIVENHIGDNERRFKILESRGYYREEQLHRTRHGEVWVDLSIQAIEANGKRYGWVILAAAITQRKLAEEALKRSEEKYRELISTSPDGILSVDSQMRIIIWNLGAEKIYGYKEKEMLGQSIMKIIPEEVQNNVAEEFFQMNKSGSSKVINRVLELSGIKKDGSRVPVDVSISTIKFENNIITTVIMRDITERKEAEEKLRKIDEMKSEFLSNVSHELRTPLQSISGFTKLIMNGQVPDPATQQEFFQIIDRETTHLGNLINSLLDMSRLEAGRFQIYRKTIPIRETIIDSIKMFHSLAREKNITLTEDIPPQIPEMEADNERMRQVVINLLSNAIKFSNPGGSVAVKVEKRENDLLFQVSDRGSGIREEAMEHLFERFYQGESEMVRGGTGLGLYISKQIVEAHGGRIWAESKFGEGSTFSFSLPLNSKGGNNDNGKENSGH